MPKLRIFLFSVALAAFTTLVAGVAMAAADEDDDPSSNVALTAPTPLGTSGSPPAAIVVTPGATVNWAAAATCTSPASGPNSCGAAGTSVGGAVPDGYIVNLIEFDSGVCGTTTRLRNPVATATTTGGAASGSFSAPTTPGSYSYKVEHPTQSIAGLTWGAVGAGSTNCFVLQVVAATPTSTISTEIHQEPGHTVVTSVTMGATIHDQATVMTTENPIPAGSSVGFQFFKNGNCSGTPFSVENVALTGGSMSESVESSSYLVLAADVATGLSYKGIFTSGNTGQVPDATGACEPLTVLSSITSFHYHVISGPDAAGNPGAYDCTLPGWAKGTSTPCPAGTTAAFITQGATNTYKVHVTVTNNTGVTISEKVQGGLTAAPGVTYSNLTFTCGSATINVSKSRAGLGNVVVWDSVGDGKTNNPGFTMAPGDICELTVDITVSFSGTGDQPITSSWSELQCLLDGPNAGFCEKSPYTNNLMAIVN